MSSVDDTEDPTIAKDGLVVSMWVAYTVPLFAIVFGSLGLHYCFATIASVAAGITLAFAYSAVIIITDRYKSKKHITTITLIAVVMLVVLAVVIKHYIYLYCYLF